MKESRPEPTRSAEDRISLEVHRQEHARERELAEIRAGLLRTPREIAPKYFYDARGSRLFDRICELPEYYPTRTEWSLLERIAPHVVETSAAEQLVELGSGSASKTRLLLDAMQRAGRLRLYVPFDFSDSTTRQVAASLAAEYPGLLVHGVIGDFMQHLESIPPGRRRLVIFLGGTIGNFTPDEAVGFLSRVAGLLTPEDTFLLGTQLITDVPRLEAAYNDSEGVTAEFNRNALRVLNDLLDGDFDPDAFAHRAFYNRAQRWIEMRLVSQRAQRVHLPALDLDIPFEPGEEIRTEISAKYDRMQVQGMLETSHLHLLEWHTDPEELFALSLSRRR